MLKKWLSLKKISVSLRNLEAFYAKMEGSKVKLLKTIIGSNLQANSHNLTGKFRLCSHFIRPSQKKNRI